MRLAVINIAIGEHYQQLSTLTHPTIRFGAVPETHLGIYNEAPFVAGRDYAIERCAEAYDAKGFKLIAMDPKAIKPGRCTKSPIWTTR